MPRSKRTLKSKKSKRVPAYIKKYAKAYCKCLKAVEKRSKGRYSPFAVCTKSVYGSRRLRGPGRAIRCTPKIYVKKSVKKR